MTRQIEKIISRLRAVLAERLVNTYGLKKSQVAKALGVSPAAITHYVSGLRGTKGPSQDKSIKDEGVDRLAERMARKISLGMIDSASTELSIFLQNLVAPQTAQKASVSGYPERSLIQTLIDRLSLEEEAAKRALELSVNASSQLTKMVLKQMAVDSMRHADILMALVHIIEKNEDVDVTKEDLRMVAEMSSFENKAEEQKLADLPVGNLGPLVKALLTSIDMDEQKHEMLLKIIVDNRGVVR